MFILYFALLEFLPYILDVYIEFMSCCLQYY